MRARLLVALALLSFGACSTTSSAMKETSRAGEPDGLSCATRVVAPSIPSEYEWVRKHYPGSKVVRQALGECDGAPADKLDVRTAEGKSITLYFDISSFFGKGF